MVIKDTNMLRSLFALKGIHRQVEIADRFHMSQNSIVRLFKGLPVHRRTATQIAEFLGRDVTELFDPKLEAVAA